MGSCLKVRLLIFEHSHVTFYSLSAMGTSEKPYISDGRKRALEALERRFTVEISQQQQKNNKRAHEKEEEGPKKLSSSTSFPAHELKDPCTPISSSKKGLPLPKSSSDL